MEGRCLTIESTRRLIPRGRLLRRGPIGTLTDVDVRTIKPGDRIAYTPNPVWTGTVVRVTAGGQVTVQWDHDHLVVGRRRETIHPVWLESADE